MSFAINVECCGEQHQVVIDLERQLIHLPHHAPELVQRYKALYELGGEPIPCCMTAIDLEPGLYPGYLHISEESGFYGATAHKAWVQLLSDAIHAFSCDIVVVPGADSPHAVGSHGFHIGAARGQIIKNVQAFEAKGGKTIHFPSTLRFLVGEAWLLAEGYVDWPHPGNLPLADPDPEWETATLT